jgi:Family of unknown function (DUF6444)
VERAEAEVILDGDRETAVALLMRVGELIEANRRLEARVTELEKRLNRSSRNSSLPRGVRKLCQYPRIRFIDSIHRGLGFARLPGVDQARPLRGPADESSAFDVDPADLVSARARKTT